MNYFEFLNKKLNLPSFLQANGNISEQQTTNPTSVFDNTKSVNFNGNSVFTTASNSDIESLDLDKLLKDPKDLPEDTKFSPLEFVLREFISLDKIKELVDTDKKDGISVEELKSFITSLMLKDGKNTELSLDDFQAIIEEAGINLEELAQQQEQQEQIQQQSQQEPVQSQTSQPAAESQSYTPEQSAPTQSSSQSSPTEGGGSVSSGGSSRGASSDVTPSQSRTIENMSLDELQAEKTKKETTLQEKQNNLNAVNRGETEGIKAAKTKKDEAKSEYEKALKEDTAAKKFADKIIKNNKQIEDNEQKINQIKVQISDKEMAISKQESVIADLENDVGSLETALASLPAPSGKEEDKEKDAKIKEKKETITKELKTKKSEVEKQKKALNKLNKELENLNQQQTKLETEKTKLLETKKQLEELVEKSCAETTKAKLEAFKKASEEYESTKASEMELAKTELSKAKNDVKEIDKKINEVKARETKAKYSNGGSATNINGLASSAISKYSPKEYTLPDGTKILKCNYSHYDKLNPEFASQVKYLNQAASELGITILYGDGTRTVAASNAGRAKKGNLVCKGGESPHNYGCATDIVLYKDGKAVGVNSDLQTQFAKRAQEISNGQIEWGGNWNKRGERHHFELRTWRKYKKPENLVG